jgi:hypothetical protein
MKTGILQTMNCEKFLSSVDKVIYICDAFHKGWIWLGTEKDVNFSSYASVDHGLATYGISCLADLCDDHMGGRNSGENEEGENYNLEQVMSSPKDHTA